MEDTLLCPICQNKMRSINLHNRHIHPLKKISDYIERSCVADVTHTIQFFTDTNIDKIDYLRISIDPFSAIHLENNYIDNKSLIFCFKNNVAQVIEVPKVIDLDFPNLQKTKEKIYLYITFS